MIDAAAIQGLANLPPLPAEEMREYALKFPCTRWFEASDAGYRREFIAQAFALTFSLQIDMTRPPYCWIAMMAIRRKRNKLPHCIAPPQWGSPFDKLVYARLRELLIGCGTGEIAVHMGERAMVARKALSSDELNRLVYVTAAHEVFCPKPII